MGRKGGREIGSELPQALYFLTNAELTTHASPFRQTISYRHRPTLGTHASLCWGGGSGPNGLGRDLRPDEALSLTFTSAALTADLDVFGFPEVLLHLQCSAAIAHVVVRLTDVAPDGTSAQVSAGVLNLTHRHGHSEPQPIDPSEVMAIRLTLRAACYRFAAGHRIRISIASAYWPVIWPSPYSAENLLHCGADRPSHLILPILDPTQIVCAPAFKTSAPDLLELGDYRAEEPVWEMIDDVIAGTKTVHVYDGDEQILPNGDRIFTAERLQMRASESNPADVSFASDVVYRLQWEDDLVAIRAKMTIRSDESAFTIEIDLEVKLNEDEFFQKHWHEVIPRQLT